MVALVVLRAKLTFVVGVCLSAVVVGAKLGVKLLLIRAMLVGGENEMTSVVTILPVIGSGVVLLA